MNNTFGLFPILYMGYDIGPTHNICSFLHMLNLSILTFPSILDNVKEAKYNFQPTAFFANILQWVSACTV